MQTYREQVYDSYATEKMPGWREAAGEKYSRWANNSLRKWGDWLPTGASARCLDVGCGPGNVAFALRAHGLTDITGVDRCEEWADPVRKTGARFVQSDAVDYLRSHPGEYNLITAFDIVEHFNKSEVLGFLTAAFEALQPGGALILQTLNAESPWGTTLRYGDLTHELSFNPDCLEYLLRKAHFETFESRECGPVVHGVSSAIRWTVWKLIWAGLAAWNIAETGNCGSGVYTRIFLMRATKKSGA